MNLLVTGAAGFIGSNFVRYWVPQHTDDRVVALAALTYAGVRENVDGLPGVTFAHVLPPSVVLNIPLSSLGPNR